MSSTDAEAGTPTAGDTATNTGTTTTEERTNSSSQGTDGTRNRGSSSNTNTFRISNFKGKVSKVGAVIGTKSENRTKELMKVFEEKISSYVMREYKKGSDIVPLIKKIEEVDVTKWKPATPTAATGATVPAVEMLEYKLLKEIPCKVSFIFSIYKQNFQLGTSRYRALVYR